MFPTLACLLLIAGPLGPPAVAPQASFQDLLARLADASPELRAPAINQYLNVAGPAPLVEGDTVIFLAEGDRAQPPRIVGDFNEWGRAAPAEASLRGEMTRIDGTDWYYLRLQFARGVRIQYAIVRGGRTETDPLNPRTVVVAGERRSEIRIPR